MNKHKKTAIIIAPFLAIGGYVAAGYYADAQVNKEQFLRLVPEGECKLLEGKCKFSSGKFLINLEQKEGMTHLATTHPIDHAVISLVKGTEKEKLYKLKKNKNRLNWMVETNLTSSSNNNSVQKIRLLLTINKVSYLGEIDSY